VVVIANEPSIDSATDRSGCYNRSMERRNRRFQDSVGYRCPHCGNLVDTTPDVGGGFDTTYIEDCPVCSHSNQIRTHFVADSETLQIDVTADF